MKSTLTLLLFALTGGLVHAAQFRTVSIDRSSRNYSFTYTYPEFFAGSVPAAATITQNIVQNLEDTACDAQDAAKSQTGYYSNSSSTVIALNSRYVSVQVDYDSYCGGAHPNYGDYVLTYDAQSGKLLDIGREFGFLDYNDPNHDFDKDQAIRKKLAEILVDRVPSDPGESCFDGLSRQEKLEEIEVYFPVVAGLARNKTVVLSISPPHAASVCRFSVRVPLSVVDPLLIPGSYLREWLR